jgi:hypothetical protein
MLGWSGSGGERIRLGQGIGRARIGEQEDAEVEASFFRGERGVVEFAPALLGGEIGFDDVGVGYFAAGLEFLREVVEGLRFVQGATGDFDFVSGGEDVEVQGNGAGDQIAARAFKVGGGLRGEGPGAAVVGDAGEAEVLVDEDLRGVFADGVVGDEAGSFLAAGLAGLIAEPIGLGEEIFTVGIGVGE